MYILRYIYPKSTQNKLSGKIQAVFILESVHLFGTQVPLFKSVVYLFGTRKRGRMPPFGTQVNNFLGTKHRFGTRYLNGGDLKGTQDNIRGYREDDRTSEKNKRKTSGGA